MKILETKRQSRSLVAPYVLLLLLLTGSCPAQSSGETDELDHEGEPGVLEEVTILGNKFGSGLSRAEFSLNKRDIEQSPPGSEIAQSLIKVPGVQISTGDARGGSFSFEIYLRGLNDEQIGLSVDGIPAGDSRFNGGSPPNRYVESSNVSTITVSQSSGEIGAPSRSALGGFINFITDDPNDEFRIKTEMGLGSFDFQRVYLRVDTGQLADGLSAYISLSDQSNDIYAGPVYRDRDRQHLDLKLLKTFDSGSTIRFRLSHNDLEDNDFGIISLGEFHDDPDSDRQLDVITGDPDIDQDFGGALGGSRKDTLVYFDLNWLLKDDIYLQIKPYYHELKGESFRYQDDSTFTTSGDPRDQSTVTSAEFDDNGTRIADMRVTPRNRERWGSTLELGFERVGINNFRLGVWYETNDSNEDRQFFRLRDPQTGIAYDQSALGYIGYERAVETNTLYLYAQDHIVLMDDRLNIDLGFTYHDIDYTVSSPLEPDPVTGSTSYKISAKTDNVDLKLGAAFGFTDQLEGFVGYSESFGGIPEDTFLGSSSAIDPRNIQPETSENLDIGLRYVADTFALSIQAYKIDFSNRVSVVPTNIDPDDIEDIINGNSSTQAVNLGGIDSKGFEITFSKFWQHFDLYATYSHQKAEWKEESANEAIRKGGQVQDIPKDSVFAEIGWSPHDDVRIALNNKYVGSRVGGYQYVPGFCNPFFCFDAVGNGVEGEEFIGADSLDSYNLVGFYISYNSGEWGFFKNLGIQLNVDNLLDENFISAVTGATSTLPEFGVIGGLTSASALDRYFIGFPRTVTFSIRAEF